MEDCPRRNRFNNALALFDNAMEDAVEISERAIGIPHTGRQNRALFIFVKLIAHCMAIGVLVAKCEEKPEGEKFLDHFSIITLGRSVIDAALMTMYISNINLEKSLWDLRRQVLFLHDLTNRNRFLLSMVKASDSSEKEVLENYDTIKNEIISKIINLSQNFDYSDEKIKFLTSGQAVYIDGARGAVREAGWDVNHFDFLQSYFSNWVHSHPVSFMRANEHGISLSDPSSYQIDICSLVLEQSESFLRDVVFRMNLFTGSIEADPIGIME